MGTILFSIESRVQSIIANQLDDVDIHEISPGAKFIDDLGGDSLDAIEVAAEVVRQFKMTSISQNQLVREIEKLETIGEITQKVQTFLQPKEVIK